MPVDGFSYFGKTGNTGQLGFYTTCKVQQGKKRVGWDPESLIVASTVRMKVLSHLAFVLIVALGSRGPTLPALC